jgi:hypothetical protein
MPGLEPGELAQVERLVRKATGARELWAERPSGGGTFNHNCVQVVGEGECEPRPHTDSRTLGGFNWSSQHLEPGGVGWVGQRDGPHG